jgi:hypothetical protein
MTDTQTDVLTSHSCPRRTFLKSLAVLGAGLGAGPAERPAWKDVKTESLKGLKVTLSAPVLVARSKSYLWFPTLVPLDGGGLLALMSNYPDDHILPSTSRTAHSADGGLTWAEAQDALYGDVHLRLSSGDELLLPYYLFPREGGLGAGYQTVPRGARKPQAGKGEVLVGGWPRPDKSFAPKLGLAGFVFNGQAVPLQDGGWLATLYGYFKDTKRYSLVAAQSRDGLRWQVRSAVADENCKLKGNEGPCEAALCRLKDGRLLCVFRMDSGAPYGQAFSGDEGKTWTEPAAVAGAFSVQPSLAVLPGGPVVLSGGRPGLYAWFNRDGGAKEWQRLAVHPHHDACVPGEPTAGGKLTTAYTEVVPLDDTRLLCIYDRIPHGWHAIPKDSKETNSVWVVRLTVERTKE